MNISRKIGQGIPIKPSKQVIIPIPIAWNEIIIDLHQAVHELWERCHTFQSAFPQTIRTATQIAKKGRTW